MQQPPRLRDDCLGLHLGATQALHVAGVLGYALRACPDVRTQIGHVTRYFALHQDGAVMDLRTDRDAVFLTYTVYDGAVMLHRHDAEATLALAVSPVHEHWFAAVGISSVHFEHPQPQATSERELRRLFWLPGPFQRDL